MGYKIINLATGKSINLTERHTKSIPPDKLIEVLDGVESLDDAIEVKRGIQLYDFDLSVVED